MNVVLSFLAGIPPRVWGAIVTVVAVLLVLWGLFSAGEAKGKEKAEAKATIEKVEARARRAEYITKQVETDAARVQEIENEIQSLPDSDIVARARLWVRKPAEDGNSN